MSEGLALRIGVVAILGASVAGCAQQQQASIASAVTPVSYTTQDRDCMARAMYFESHRGSDDGMRAVGTVVANRLKSGRYGSNVCDVVGQKGQFAAGLMNKRMDDSGAERAQRVAGEVLAGKRHAGVRDAMFFHTAGLKFRYPNMHYVLVAGGNAFYEKREVATEADARDNARSKALAMAYARVDPTGAAKPIIAGSSDRIEVAAAQQAIQPVAQVTTTVAQPKAAPVAAPASPAPVAVAKAEPAKPAIAAKPTAKPVAEPQLASVAQPSRPVTLAKAAEPAKARVIDPAKAASEASLASAAPVAKTAAKPAKPAATSVAAAAAPATAPQASAPSEHSAWSRVADAFSSMPSGSPMSGGEAPSAGFTASAYAR